MTDKLFRARELRIRPGVDDKALTSWNALMLSSFSEAARYLDRDDYKLVAMRNGKFLTQDLMDGSRLFRSWRAEKSNHHAYLEDYASLIIALISLYQTDPDPTWFETALSLTNEMITHFYDSNGCFLTPGMKRETDHPSERYPRQRHTFRKLPGSYCPAPHICPPG
jgi:uncharacterized protein YyaL (SSP411 family)